MNDLGAETKEDSRKTIKFRVAGCLSCRTAGHTSRTYNTVNPANSICRVQLEIKIWTVPASCGLRAKGFLVFFAGNPGINDDVHAAEEVATRAIEVLYTQVLLAAVMLVRARAHQNAEREFAHDAKVRIA